MPRVKGVVGSLLYSSTHSVLNLFLIFAGGEWDYVILSTVRSLPSYKIEPNPTYGWRRQNLGFITDCNQVNVALTRARRGLFIIGELNNRRCANLMVTAYCISLRAEVVLLLL